LRNLKAEGTGGGRIFFREFFVAGPLNEKLLEALEIKTLAAAVSREIGCNSFIDAVGNPVVQPPGPETAGGSGSFPCCRGFFGILLLNRQEIDVPFTGGIEGVVVGALAAVWGVKERVPADRAWQDNGHGITSFVSH
jgi:hypothetical protein